MDNSISGPRVSVIIPHFNQVEMLGRCLQSIVAQGFDGDVEVIVADNATPGGLGDLPVLYPGVQFLVIGERGAACARNGAMAIARGDVLAFIDADCVAAPNWLAEGVNALKATDLVGGDVTVSVEDEQNLTDVEAFERVFAFRQREYILKKNFSVTANLFVWRKIASTIGSFTNGLSEDVDWCHRAHKLGFRLVFADRAKVNHPARQDWSELLAKWERLVRERRNGFGARGFIGRLAWSVLAVLTGLSAAPHLGRVVATGQLQTFRDRIGAARVLIGIRVWRARKMMSLLRSTTPQKAERLEVERIDSAVAGKP